MPFPAALVQVDVDAGRIGRNYPVREGVVADVGLFCDAMLAAGVSGGARDGTAAARAAVAGRQSEVAAHGFEPERELMHQLDLALPDDAIALCRSAYGMTEFPDEGPVVERAHVMDLARRLKEELGYLFFVYCTATHYPADEKTGAPDRTLVAYRVNRLPSADGRRLQSFPFRLWVPTGEATPSLVPIWAGADWQEREQFDLVGTVFEGHPDLRRIMMPEDWPGHPLRKEYAIETQHFPWR